MHLWYVKQIPINFESGEFKIFGEHLKSYLLCLGFTDKSSTLHFTGRAVWFSSQLVSYLFLSLCYLATLFSICIAISKLINLSRLRWVGNFLRKDDLETAAKLLIAQFERKRKKGRSNLLWTDDEQGNNSRGTGRWRLWIAITGGNSSKSPVFKFTNLLYIWEAVRAHVLFTLVILTGNKCLPTLFFDDSEMVILALWCLEETWYALQASLPFTFSWCSREMLFCNPAVLSVGLH